VGEFFGFLWAKKEREGTDHRWEFGTNQGRTVKIVRKVQENKSGGQIFAETTTRNGAAKSEEAWLRGINIKKPGSSDQKCA